MANVIKADLDDIVFEPREKRYGAYQLRKQYRNYLTLAFLIVGATFAVATVGPFLWEKLKAGLAKDEEKKVMMDMSKLPPPPPIEENTPPPPPPPDEPPPPEKVVAFKPPEPKEIPEEKEEAPPPPIDSTKNVKTGKENIEGEKKGAPDGIPEGKGEPKPAEVAKDTDGDGIFDDEDDCPKEKGERKYKGCPPPPPPPPKAPDDPDPNKFVFAQEQPKPINMDEVKKAIGYPPVAKEAGIEGQVMLRILVDEQGNYIRHIISKAAHPLLQAEVEKHARELHFTPAIQGGKPIKFWVNIPFNFKLQ